MVTECLLTRSILIKMYLPLHGKCPYMYIVFAVSQFHADAHYLVFSNCINVLFDTTVLSENIDISLSRHVWRVFSVLAVLL